MTVPAALTVAIVQLGNADHGQPITQLSTHSTQVAPLSWEAQTPGSRNTEGFQSWTSGDIDLGLVDI